MSDPKPVKCKYGHIHSTKGYANDCEDRTFRELCRESGLDFKAESQRELNTLPAPPPAEQLEAFPELIRKKRDRKAS